jgi:TPR repeat protein
VAHDRSILRAALVAIALVAPLTARAEPVTAQSAAIAADPVLKDMRRRMLAGDALSDTDLRRLADAGEGLAAARFAERLEARGTLSVLDDAAHYYAIAVYVDRDFALPRLISLLGRSGIDIAPGRLTTIRDVLDGQARGGNPVAAAGLARLLLRGRPFGTDVAQARALLLMAAEAGDGQAAILLALNHIQGAPGVLPDAGAARPALTLALASPDPGVQAMAATLVQRLPDGPPILTALAPASATLRPRARPLPSATERPSP